MKILIADDDEVSRIRLEDMLVKHGYDVMAVADGHEAWQVLQGEDRPKLAILDWMMPGMDGLELCRKVRQNPDAPYVYILLLTAKAQKEDIVHGLEAGADDYITKPFDDQELQARLRTGQRIVELQEALRALATRDSLTGLWNHAMILDILGRKLTRGAREETPVGIIMADLDRFKQVNDTYGHLMGDAVLGEAAKRMQAVLRPYDSVGRYGGEEFLIVLPNCDRSKAINIAERLRRSISDVAVNTAAGVIPLTASFGVTTSQGSKLSVNELIQEADEALYRAKLGGRNRVEVAERRSVEAHRGRSPTGQS